MAIGSAAPLTLTETWTIVSGFAAAAAATAAAASAGIAGWQLRQTRVESQRHVVFDHLREIDARLAPLWQQDTAVVADEVLRCYRERCEVSSDGARYLSFLNSLDMLAFARRHGVADKRLADEYVRTLFRRHLVSLSFLDAFQKCCGDSNTYEHLRQYVVDNRQNLLQQERGQ